MNWQQIKNKLLKPKAPDGVFSAKGIAQANKNKKTMALMLVLMFVFIFVIIRAFNKSSPSIAVAKSSVAANVNISVNTNTKVNSTVNEKKINWQRPQPYPATLRDPMQLNFSVDTQAGSGILIVKGIISSEDRPAAVIDDRIMHQGDKLGRVTIIKINKNNVEFEMEGKRWTQEVQQ